MLETPHVALGIAVAKTVPNPLISIPLSFAGHFLLDMIPHWNPHLNTEIKKFGKLTNNTLFIIGLDALSAILFVYFSYNFFSHDPLLSSSILFSSFASVLPDAIEAPYYLMGIKNKFLNYWIKFQKSIQADANLFWGIVTQVAVLALSAFYIFS